MRRFVREIIPRRSKPPQILDSTKLDDETRNFNSRAVRDDGVEVKMNGSPGQELGESTTDSEEAAKHEEHLFVRDRRQGASAPPPMVRARSHPDMARLCKDWARGPANFTTSYKTPTGERHIPS